MRRRVHRRGEGQGTKDGARSMYFAQFSVSNVLSWSVVYRPFSTTLLLCAILLSSCFKEKPIKPPVIITNAVYTANMGENYTQQLYFNIQTGSFVDSNSKYDYDMSFDCGFTYNIWINGSNLALVCRTAQSDILAASFADTTAGWHEELGSGLGDSKAIGNWQTGLQSNMQVYIINRGVDSLGHSLGFVKMQMGNFTGNNYSVTFCNMDDSNMHTVSVPKVQNKNHVFLSFNNGGMVHNFEPDQDNWDFFFTQYSVFFGPPNNINYKVTGLLTNPYRTYAYYMDSTTNFDSISLKNVIQPKTGAPYNNIPQDNIGYDWKRFNGVSYTLNRYNYIIKSDNGQYYKMRFLNFYNANDIKGYPQFQYFLLQ